MTKKEGLRVGQVPGAVAKDGGQTTQARWSIYPRLYKKSSKKQEVDMKNQQLVQGGCSHSEREVLDSAFVTCACLAAVVVMTVIAVIIG